MAKNRLKLDFSLESAEERSTFINIYLNSEPFLSKPPTTTELEKISDYLLWGKNEAGASSNANGEIELKSTWSSHPVLSLDELIESPAFNEDSISPINSIPTKTSKKVFSRDLARKEAPPHILPLYESLWNEIDSLDLCINFYELHNSKKTEIRPELLSRFSEADLARIEAQSKTLNQYSYLKKRRLLIEKRREQFTLQDFYQKKRARFIPKTYSPHEDPILDADLRVLPAGLRGSSKLSKVFFVNELRLPLPTDLPKELEKPLSDFIWTPAPAGRHFDFRDVTHLQKLMALWEEFSEDLDSLPYDSTMHQLLETFEWYRARADLSPIEDEILTRKIQKAQNQQIVEEINEKFSKTYNPNYISTLYNKKALGKISAVAQLHRDHIENLFFGENFKTCRECGRTFLLDSRNFMRKQQSKDGFSCRCKECDKKRRLKYAEGR